MVLKRGAPSGAPEIFGNQDSSMQIRAAFKVSLMPLAGMMACISPCGRFRAAMPASLMFTENSEFAPDFMPAPNMARVDGVLVIPVIALFMVTSPLTDL